MKFSTRTEYGMRAMVHLARNYGRKPVSLANIAKAERISQPYLERLMAGLKANNLIIASKGVSGGYQLAKAPKSISLFEIIVALEGPIAVFSCLAVNQAVACVNKNCLTKKVWLAVQDQMIKILKRTKLSKLI